MLTIDEYIRKMKKADKLDEFDSMRIPENMATVLKYVTSYFNDYLSIDGCDAETLKHKRAVEKLRSDVEERFPLSKDFLIEFYLRHKLRLDREVEKFFRRIKYIDFIFLDEEYEEMSLMFCQEYKLAEENMSNHQTGISVLMKEVKYYITEPLTFNDTVNLGEDLAKWVKDTYAQYEVNLMSYAYRRAEQYYNKYIKYQRQRFEGRTYVVNHYDHRYNENAFNMQCVYEENKHRPFIVDRCCELEMLVMCEWLFTFAHDEDYWSEYVNLCVSTGRATIAASMKPLIAVACGGLHYPSDIPCEIELVTTATGEIRGTPVKKYLLHVDIPEDSQVWNSPDKMDEMALTLNTAFKRIGTPQLLEMSAPYRTASFNEMSFFLCCSHLEKKLKKHAHMRIAISNGSGNQRTKPRSYLSTIDDILVFREKLREKKLHIRLSIDIPLLLSNKRGTGRNEDEAFLALSEIKNAIICFRASYAESKFHTGVRYMDTQGDADIPLLDRYERPCYNDVYGKLAGVFWDKQKRFFIPKGVKSDAMLENLVDGLLRSGFSFYEVHDDENQ